MRILITVLALLLFIELQGQNKQLLYNFDELPQTLMSNPGASIFFDGHVGVPLFSQIYFSAGTTGVNLHDIFSNSSPDINSRVSQTVKRLTSKDYFTAREQLEILSLGWRLDPSHYLSAGVYQELDFFSYFPKDPALLISEGNSNYLNVPFDFSHVAFTGEVLTVYHLGLNKKVDHQLTVGGRIKLYSGIFNVESVDNTGMFITRTTPGGVNYYRHFAENIDITVNTSGFASLQDDAETVEEGATSLLSRSMFGGNVGAGIDLGATYIVNTNLIVTGSVQDVGVIFQQSDVENYLYYGSYQTSGIEPLFPDIDPTGKALPYWDEFEDEVDANLKDETLNEKYITWRPFKINASVEYGFGRTYAPCNYLRPANRRHKNLAGIHIFGIKRLYGVKYALTTYFDRKFSEGVRMKFSYTLDDFSYTNVGVLLSTQMRNFNFYIAADNLIGYFNLAKSHHQSVQLGFQFIFKR